MALLLPRTSTLGCQSAAEQLAAPDAFRCGRQLPAQLRSSGCTRRRNASTVAVPVRPFRNYCTDCIFLAFWSLIVMMVHDERQKPYARQDQHTKICTTP